MKLHARIFVALALATGIGMAQGATGEWTDAISGRLQQIKATHAVRIGYRDSAIPFSYVGPDGVPVGYSIDICERIVATIAEELGVADLRAEYVRVTAVDRIERVVSGAVDIECGSTTITAARRREVAFSPVIFITGTRLAVPHSSGVRDANDLRGKQVAVVRGTTNEIAMREYDRLRGLGVVFVTADGYREAIEMLSSGRAVALAADDVLLRGLIAEAERARNFRIVGELLSFETYGIMYPRDDAAFAGVVERSLRTLAETREIVWMYDRWFVRPLPSGRRLDLPMGVELRRSLELIGLPPD
ncbi:MAG TPA: amino acid ABC transporter substrate-binding protein [Casimicrobiaceae bacterium]|nr:amino acid ABC transporter substrate-binding protein [Casimicrobiaceae bacterium]